MTFYHIINTSYITVEAHSQISERVWEGETGQYESVLAGTDAVKFELTHIINRGENKDIVSDYGIEEK